MVKSAALKICLVVNIGSKVKVPAANVGSSPTHTIRLSKQAFKK